MYDYTKLTFTELVVKIGKSRFFHLPKMLEEILGRLVPQAPKYKVYTALLSQTGTDAPVATVLENTLGGIVWSYYDVGQYQAQLAGKLPLDKRVILISPTNAADGTTEGYTVFSDEDITNDSFIIKFISNTGEAVNNLAQPRGIEIRVYN